MVKTFAAALVGAGLLGPLSAYAQDEESALPYEPGVTDRLVNDPAYLQQAMARHWSGIEEKIVLRDVDKKALAASKRWRDAEGAPGPQAGDGGRVVFQYGLTLPKVVCAPQRVCDIELEPGEIVSPHSVHCGDKSNWSIAPGRQGTTTHLIVSPKFAGLRTNLTVLTDRRTYHFELESLSDDHMPFVAFTYPPDPQELWAEYMRQAGRDPTTKKKAEETPPPVCDVRVDPSRLRYDYEVEKAGWWRARRRIDWAPTRVWDDGQVTTIELPRHILRDKLPALFITDGRSTMEEVTYQPCGNLIHLHKIFHEALLVRAVGTNQERVFIRRRVED